MESEYYSRSTNTDEEQLQLQCSTGPDEAVSSNDQQKWYHIDKYMLPAKFVYFFQMAKDFCYQPFLVLFLIESGLSVQEASLIAGIRLVGMLFGSPFFGFIGDKTCKHRYVVIFMCIASILLMGSQPIISSRIGDDITNVCPARDLSNSSSIVTKTQRKMYNNQLFIVMLLTNIGASFVDGGTMGMMDNGVVHRIICATKKKDFGWNRLFGAVGFGAGSLVAGYVVQHFPKANVTCYSGIFIVYLLCMTGLLISAWFLYHTPVRKSDSQNISSLLLTTLKKLDSIIFLMTVCLMGIEQGLFVNFTTLTLNKMGASKFVQGLSISVAGYSCIISILLSTRLISLFRGTWNTMIICTMSYIIRFALFSHLRDPIYAIPISLFQSFGLGLFITASVHHVRMTSPVRLHTTMYGIMNATHYGAGFLIASLVGGTVYDIYGSRILFSSAAVLMSIWCMLLIIYRMLVWFKFKRSIP